MFSPFRSCRNIVRSNLTICRSKITILSLKRSEYAPIRHISKTNFRRMTSDQPQVNLTEDQWRAQLSPEQFHVLREAGTEAPGTGKYDKHYPEKGVYNCAGCDTPLYQAKSKFKSGCGWPAFFDAIPGSITQHDDDSDGRKRIELRCAKCKGHLGHLFKGEGFPTPTNERHCINSISINFGSDEQPKDKS